MTAPLLSQLFRGIGMQQIKQLELESKQVADDTLATIAYCGALRTLTLHCIKLTGAALDVISRGCRQLSSVDISGCSRVCDEGVISLATYCITLARLNVSQCHRLTDQAVIALALRPAKSLEMLAIDRCLRVSFRQSGGAHDTSILLVTLSYS